MRILLTGGTGFVGTKVAAELARVGHEVIILTRQKKQESSYELRTWDEPLEDIDAVIHLAGESIAAGRWTKKQKEKIVTSRTETTKKLLARVGSGSIFIATSAIGYYGDRGDEILTEGSAPGQGFLAEVCEAWEKETAKATEKFSRLVTLRLGMVLGKNGGALQKMLPIFRAGVGGKLGSGQQWMSWIHIDDLAQIILLALNETSMHGTYNAVSPNPVQNFSFTKSLADALQVRALLPAPAFALKLALGEMSTLLLDSQRVTSRLPYSFRYPHLDGALTTIVN